MKKLFILLIIVLILGCDDGEDPLEQLFYDLPLGIEWICTTDSPNDSPLPEIFNSLDECESVCSNELLEVTTPDFPDGTGQYYSMYCSENE